MHDADLPLLQSGTLRREDLYTLRRGEPVHDQVRKRIMLLDTECIKIRSLQGRAVCRFYQSASGLCAIHATKPLECVALRCWDTTDLTTASARPRLFRRDIIAENSALAELISDHENVCAVNPLLTWLQDDTPESSEKIRQSMAYDAALRDLLMEKARITPDLLPFLLGRPLPEVVQGLRRWLARREESKGRY